MDTGSYCVNLLRYLVGNRKIHIDSAHCEPVSVQNPHVDITTHARFHSDDDIQIEMECSIYSIIPKITCTVLGENGSSFSALNWVCPQILYNRLGLKNLKGFSRVESFSKDVSTYEYQLRAFCTAIQKNQPFLTTAHDAVYNMQVIDEIYRTAKFPIRGTKL